MPITDMLIHRITLLLHLVLNSAKEFGRKVGEHDLAERMKDKFKLVNKPRKYSISSTTDLSVKVATQILARKIMRKCRVDDLSTLVVSLAAQCVEGVQFNWAQYLLSEFLRN